MEALIEALPYILRGVPITLVVLGGSISLGLISGLVMAIAEVYGFRFLSMPVYLIEATLRAIPVLVLLYLFYFGLLGFPPLLVAIFALGLRSGAYQSQIFRGAIESIQVGQTVAAQSLGMGRFRVIYYIVLPQAIRLAIGPWTNEYNVVTKATSYAYLVGALELLRRARYVIAASHGNAVLIYSFCAIIYYMIAQGGCSILYRIESKLRVPGFEARGGWR